MIRTLLVAVALTGCAAAPASRREINEADIAALGCETGQFQDSLVRLHPFPELKEETLLAVCYSEHPAAMPNGRSYTAHVQDLVLVDSTTFAELDRHDIGCCIMRDHITISLRETPIGAAGENWTARNLSPALIAKHVTRSIDIYVDQKGVGHEFRVVDGRWLRLFLD